MSKCNVLINSKLTWTYACDSSERDIYTELFLGDVLCLHFLFLSVSFYIPVNLQWEIK